MSQFGTLDDVYGTKPKPEEKRLGTLADVYKPKPEPKRGTLDDVYGGKPAAEPAFAPSRLVPAEQVAPEPRQGPAVTPGSALADREVMGTIGPPAPEVGLGKRTLMNIQRLAGPFGAVGDKIATEARQQIPSKPADIEVDTSRARSFDLLGISIPNLAEAGREARREVRDQVTKAKAQFRDEQEYITEARKQAGVAAYNEVFPLAEGEDDDARFNRARADEDGQKRRQEIQLQLEKLFGVSEEQVRTAANEGRELEPDIDERRLNVLREMQLGAARSTTGAVVAGNTETAGSIASTLLGPNAAGDALSLAADFFSKASQAPELAPSSRLAEGGIRLTDANYYAKLIGEQGPIIADMVLAGRGAGGLMRRLGGGVTAQTKAGRSAGTLAGFALEGGNQINEARRDMLARGEDPAKADEVARREGYAYGIVASMLEYAPLAKFVEGSAINRSRIVRTVRQALEEGTTEAAQSTSQSIAAMLGRGQDMTLREVADRALEEGVAGFIVGGGMGAVTNGTQQAAESTSSIAERADTIATPAQETTDAVERDQNSDPAPEARPETDAAPTPDDPAPEPAGVADGAESGPTEPIGVGVPDAPGVRGGGPVADEAAGGDGAGDAGGRPDAPLPTPKRFGLTAEDMAAANAVKPLAGMDLAEAELVAKGVRRFMQGKPGVDGAGIKNGVELKVAQAARKQAEKLGKEQIEAAVEGNQAETTTQAPERGTVDAAISRYAAGQGEGVTVERVDPFSEDFDGTTRSTDTGREGGASQADGEGGNRVGEDLAGQASQDSAGRVDPAEQAQAPNPDQAAMEGHGSQAIGDQAGRADADRPTPAIEDFERAQRAAKRFGFDTVWVRGGESSTKAAAFDRPSGSIIVDVAAADQVYDGLIAHEIGHGMKDQSRELWDDLRNYLTENQSPKFEELKRDHVEYLDRIGDTTEADRLRNDPEALAEEAVSLFMQEEAVRTPVFQQLAENAPGVLRRMLQYVQRVIAEKIAPAFGVKVNTPEMDNRVRLVGELKELVDASNRRDVSPDQQIVDDLIGQPQDDTGFDPGEPDAADGGGPLGGGLQTLTAPAATRFGLSEGDMQAAVALAPENKLAPNELEAFALGARQFREGRRTYKDTTGVKVKEVNALRDGFKAAKVAQGQVVESLPQTDTIEFEEWFGNSPVRDETGQPLIVYHGTKTGFNSFDLDQSSPMQNAVFFTPDPELGSAFADAKFQNPENPRPQVVPAYLSLQNPKTINWPEVNGGEALFNIIEMGDQIDIARAEGYDGLIVENVEDGTNATVKTGTQYLAFEPTQIKSAIGNAGTFDPTNDDIRYAVRRDNPDALGPFASYASTAETLDAATTDILRLMGVINDTANQAVTGLGAAIFGGTTKAAGKAGGRALIERLADTSAGEAVITAAEATARQLAPQAMMPVEAAALLRETRIRDAYGKTLGSEYARILSKGGTSAMLGLTVPKKLNTQSNRRKMYDVLTGEAEVDSLPADLRNLAKSTRETIDRLGREAVAVGLLSPETLARTDGSYLPRLYGPKEMAKFGVRGVFGNLRQSLDRFKFRKSDAFWVSDKRGNPVSTGRKTPRFDSALERDSYIDQLVTQEMMRIINRGGGDPRLTESDLMPSNYAKLPEKLKRAVEGVRAEVSSRYSARDPLDDAALDKMGLIREPGYPVGKAIIQLTHDIQLARTFNQIAGNESWVSNEEQPGFKPIPDVPGYGKLAGKYVRAEIADDIVGMRDATGVVGAFYDDMLRYWKTGKTVYNPSTHGRNLMGNLVFADFAQVSPMNPLNWKYYRRAARVLRGTSSSELLQEVNRVGVLGGDFSSQELRSVLERLDVRPTPQSPLGWAWKIASLQPARQFAQKAYGMEDEIFKTASYLKNRDMGMAPREAAAKVRKFFPFYDQIPKTATIKAARRGPLPFGSFLYEALRIGANAVQERPLALAKWAAVPSLLTLYAATQLGLDDEDMESVRKDMRGQIQGFPVFSALMPFRDEQDRLVQFDLTNIVPYAGILGSRIDRGDDAPLHQRMTQSLLLGNPFVNTGVGLALNRDPFFDRPLRQTAMTGPEAAAAEAGFVAKQMLPPLTPFVGSTWRVLFNDGVMRGTLQKRNREQQVLRSLAGVDLRFAGPRLHRLVDEYFAEFDKPPRAAFGGDSTPASRLRSTLYQAVLDEDKEAFADAIKALGEIEQDVATAKDMRRLIDDRHPLRRVNQTDRSEFLKQLGTEESRMVNKILSEFQTVRSRGPKMWAELRR